MTTRKTRAQTKRLEHESPLDVIVNHDLDTIDDEILDPIEVRRRAAADAKSSFEKFSHQLA